MRTSGRHTLSITLDVGLSNVMDGRRQRTAPTPAAPPPKKQADTVYLLADTSTVSVTVSREKVRILTAIPHSDIGPSLGPWLTLRLCLSLIPRRYRTQRARRLQTKEIISGAC